MYPSSTYTSITAALLLKKHHRYVRLSIYLLQSAISNVNNVVWVALHYRYAKLSLYHNDYMNIVWFYEQCEHSLPQMQTFYLDRWSIAKCAGYSRSSSTTFQVGLFQSLTPEVHGSRSAVVFQWSSLRKHRRRC